MYKKYHQITQNQKVNKKDTIKTPENLKDKQINKKFAVDKNTSNENLKTKHTLL